MTTVYRVLIATTVLKTCSWMFVSATIVFCCVLVETGNIHAALISALVAASLKTPFYTVHEWAWNKITGHHKVHLPEGTIDEPDEPGTFGRKAA